MSKTLAIETSPHLASGASVDIIMRNVIYALLPVTLFAIYLFGLPALLVLLTATASCVLTEHTLCRLAGRDSTVMDGSVVITGLLYGLTLPPSLPLWMVAVGGFIGVALGKFLFGGLGYNAFNPALVGRAFLQAAFPAAMTTWHPALLEQRFAEVPASLLTFPFARPEYDGLTAATPLAQMKFDQLATPGNELLLGMTAGSTGETGALLILLGGAWLVARNMMNWRIPAAIFTTVAALSALLHWAAPADYPRGRVHGDGHGGLPDHHAWCRDLRRTDRRGRGGHPAVGRHAGGRDVRHSAGQRGLAPHRPAGAAARFRHRQGGRVVNQADIIATDGGPRPAWHMYRAMVGVGVICALLIVAVYVSTLAIIARNHAAALERAVLEVVPGAATFRRHDLGQPVYAAFDTEGRLAGIALEAQGMGYQDTVRILYGYDPRQQAVVGMRVLQSRETPGLGDRVETDPAFTANFNALDVRLAADGDSLAHPVELVKPGEKTAPWQIDAISGATITSAAVAEMLARSTAHWVPLLYKKREALARPPEDDDVP
jgi:electron transport complex protein RnfD